MIGTRRRVRCSPQRPGIVVGVRPHGARSRMADGWEDEMTVKKGDTAKAYYVADILPGGSGENGRYVIVGLKLAAPDGPPSVTHVAFRADQFDRFLIQLL